jgi:6-phosphofructokinase
MLGSILGASATAHLIAGKSGGMIGLRDNRVLYVPYRNVIGKKKVLPRIAMSLAEILAT